MATGRTRVRGLRHTIEVPFTSEVERKAFETRLKKVKEILTPAGSPKLNNKAMIERLFDLAEQGGPPAQATIAPDLSHSTGTFPAGAGQDDLLCENTASMTLSDNDPVPTPDVTVTTPSVSENSHQLSENRTPTQYMANSDVARKLDLDESYDDKSLVLECSSPDRKSSSKREVASNNPPPSPDTPTNTFPPSPSPSPPSPSPPFSSRSPSLLITDSTSSSGGYPDELASVLSGNTPIPDSSSLEEEVFRSFRQPPSTRSHLHAVAPSPGTSSTDSTLTLTPSTSSRHSPKSTARKKIHFNYLLLDPTKMAALLQNQDSIVNPPSPESELERLSCLVGAVFYVGKGCNLRPLQHLKDARDNRSKPEKLTPKSHRVLGIWVAGRGVISLQLFNNTMDEEALTREACMIDAIGLKVLTNIQRGSFYGKVQEWTDSKQREFGVFLLVKALRIFLLDNPQEIFEDDL